MVARVAVIAILLGWYSVVGHLRTNDWTSELALWTRSVEISPTNPRSHLNRGKALMGLGRDEESWGEVGLAVSLEAARGIKP